MIQIQQIAQLTGHQSPIYTIVCSQKPGILFSAGSDKGVVEWDLINQQFIKVLFPVQSSVYALHAPLAHLAPILVAGERSGRVTIFHFEEQKVTQVLTEHTSPIFDIKSVASKKELITCSEDGTVCVYQLDIVSPCSLIKQFKVSTAGVRVMAIDPSESKIAFGCKDNLIYVYSLSDYSLLKVLAGHTLGVSSLQFSPDGKYLLSGGRDATLKYWDANELSLVKSINAHLFAIYDIAFHPEGHRLATASRDKSIKLWNAHDFSLIKTISQEKGYPSHRLSVNKISWDPSTHHLISAGDDTNVLIWDVKL